MTSAAVAASSATAATTTVALGSVSTILLLFDEFLLFFLDLVVFGIFRENENLFRFFDAFLQSNRCPGRLVLSCGAIENDIKTGEGERGR